jgi:hypothetical protein
MRVVTVLDFNRIAPLVREWSSTMVSNGAGQEHVVGTVDGKCWKWTRPGTGKFAQALAAFMSAHGNAGTTPNLLQRVSGIFATPSPSLPVCLFDLPMFLPRDIVHANVHGNAR